MKFTGILSFYASYELDVWSPYFNSILTTKNSKLFFLFLFQKYISYIETAWVHFSHFLASYSLEKSRLIFLGLHWRRLLWLQGEVHDRRRGESDRQNNSLNEINKFILQ
jgi:hypothetical protein